MPLLKHHLKHSGISCGWNATLATLNLEQGAWRHSNSTLDVWACPSKRCAGGNDSGVDGDSCEAHYPYGQMFFD